MRLSGRIVQRLLPDDDATIADYTLVYDAAVFEDAEVDSVVDAIEAAVKSSLESLKNLSVGEYETDPAYIDSTVEDLVEDCKLNT